MQAQYYGAGGTTIISNATVSPATKQIQHTGV